MNDENNDRWLVVVNPQASVGKARRDWPDIKHILEEEGCDFDYVFTERIGHGVEITKQHMENHGYHKLMAVGGDGTINEVVNGIFSQKRFNTNEVTLGVIPVGTGNDWGRMFEYPNDYHKIVKILKAGKPFMHDIGRVSYQSNDGMTERYFINTAGIGFDQVVAAKTNYMKMQGKGGKINYLWSLITCFFSYKIVPVKITMDDDMIFNDMVFSLSLGNCRYTGGGFMQTPKALPDDGCLDLTIIRNIPIFKAIRNIPNLYNGSFVDKLKEVSSYRGKKIIIESKNNKTLPIETDGEILGNAPFEFSVIPQALQVIVKQNAIRKIHIETKRQG